MDRPGPATPAPRLERGISVHGGESCYLCDAPVRDGDSVILYFDATFWQQVCLYHSRCWSEADLAAKEYGGDSVRQARALAVPEVQCPRCRRPIAAGDLVVRVRGAAAGDRVSGRGALLPRVFHEGCFDAGSE